MDKAFINFIREILIGSDICNDNLSTSLGNILKRFFYIIRNSVRINHENVKKIINWLRLLIII